MTRAIEPGFSCPLCGATSARIERTLRDQFRPDDGRRYPLARCAGCGLLRLHPQPDAATLAAAYGDDYAPHVRPGLSGWAKGQLERRSVRQLRRYLEAPRRVLDVGCATGDVLHAVRAAGNPNVLGIEPGERAAAAARARGLEVVTGELEHACLRDASIDTAILSHTLEHVPDPVATLRELARVLKPGGALILWLPNGNSIEAQLLGGYWIGYDAPRHLTTFNVDTLQRALEQMGFRVSDVRYEAVGLEWAWALRLWLRERARAADRVLSLLHPLLIVAGTPAAMVGAVVGKSGRVRVITVRKP